MLSHLVLIPPLPLFKLAVTRVYCHSLVLTLASLVQHVSGISREMIREGLPIQCVEATFLGIYLTMVALKHLDTLTVLTPNSNKPAPPFTISGAGKGCR